MRRYKIYILGVCCLSLLVTIMFSLRAVQKLSTYWDSAESLKSQIKKDTTSCAEVVTYLREKNFEVKEKFISGVPEDQSFFDFTSGPVDRIPPLGKTLLGVMLMTRSEVVGTVFCKNDIAYEIVVERISSDAL